MVEEFVANESATGVLSARLVVFDTLENNPTTKQSTPIPANSGKGDGVFCDEASGDEGETNDIRSGIPVGLSAKF
jgi:hypothetical protein